MCQYHGKVFAVFHSVLLFVTYFIIFNINKLPFKRSYTRRSCFSPFVLNSIKQTVGVVDFFKGRKMITKKKKKKSWIICEQREQATEIKERVQLEQACLQFFIYEKRREGVSNSYIHPLSQSLHLLNIFGLKFN